MGRLGRYAGQFVSPHNITADSKGNLYVAEDLGGQREQKFAFKGLGNRSNPFANFTTEEDTGPKCVGSHHVRARVFGNLTGDTESGGERFVKRDLEREARFYEPNVPRGRFRWDKIG